MVGLNLQVTGRDSARLWVDGVQLEVAQEAGEFATRQTVEMGLSTDKVGNVFAKGEGLGVTVAGFNDGPAARLAEGTVVVTDYWDEPVFEQPVALSLPAGAGHARRIDTGIERAGFYRVKLLRMGESEPSLIRNLRCAIIKPYDSVKHSGLPRTGIDSPLTWPSLRRLGGQAGLGLCRYWEMYWDQLEPEPGHSDYTDQERDIAGLRRDGYIVQAMVNTVHLSTFMQVLKSTSGGFL